MPLSLAIFSALSPMVRPVDGSLRAGGTGRRSAIETPRKLESFWPTFLPRLARASSVSSARAGCMSTGPPLCRIARSNRPRAVGQARGEQTDAPPAEVLPVAVGGLLHGVADHAGHGVSLVRWGFQHELVVDLEQHPGLETIAPQRVVNADHRDLDQVRRRSLDRRVRGHPLTKGTNVEVAIIAAKRPQLIPIICFCCSIFCSSIF